MKKDWEIKSFEDCIENVKYTTKIPSKDYKQEGAFPIVSQEEELISGYWDNESDLFSLTKPVVIFGDHTRVLKYVDFDFVLGADGVKILQPKDFLDTKFFMYFLSNANIKHLGYARHYRLLKELNVFVPPLEEQKRIVKILDEKFAQLETIKANAQANLQNAKDLFQSQITSVLLSNLNWTRKTLGDTVVVERGSSPRPIEQYLTTDETGVNWIKIGDTKNVDKVIYSTKEKITPEGAKKSRYVKKGDFILSNSMSLGKPYIMGTDGYIHDGWFVLRLPEDINTDYFFYLLSSNFVQEQFTGLAAGAIVKNISSDLVKKAILIIPPLPEQKRIVKDLDTLSEKVRQLQEIYTKQIANCAELKQAYLQKAFEGEM